MHLYRRISLVLVLTFGIASMQCQTAAPTPADTAPSFQSKVNVVLIDVVVTNGNDEPVAGLDKTDFQVLEDNKVQPISVFEEHKGGVQPSPSKLPPMAPGVYTNFPPVKTSDAVNVVLLDAVNTQAWDQATVHSQLARYLTNVPHGTRLAAFTLTARLHLLTGITTDASVLSAALTDPKAASGPQQSLLLSSTNEMNPDDWQNGELDRMTTPMENELADFIMRRTSYAELQQLRTEGRMELTLQALQQLARYLAGIPGRKNVIWFSGSFPIILFPNPNMLDPFFDSARRHEAELKKVAGLLAAAQVAIYPVQAEGLVQSFGYDADASEIGQTRGSLHTQDQSRSRNRDANYLTMDTLAQDTGGKAFYNTNGIDDAFARAMNHGSRYYTLTYSPDNKKMDGRYRRIEVKLSPAKYKLAYRRGYYAGDAKARVAKEQQVNDPLLPLMSRGLPNLSQIIYKIRVLPSNPQPAPEAGRAGSNSEMKGPFTRYDVDFAIAVQDLKLDATPDGVHNGDVEVVLIAYARDGVALNLVVKKPQMSLKSQAFAAAQTVGVQLRYEIDVPKMS